MTTTTSRRSDTSTVTLRALDNAGTTGLTWRDLAAVLGVHHGSASGALSRLHRLGQIDRLARQHSRNGLAVYVLSSNVGARTVVPPIRRRRAADNASVRIASAAVSLSPDSPYATVTLSREVVRTLVRLAAQ